MMVDKQNKFILIFFLLFYSIFNTKIELILYDDIIISDNIYCARYYITSIYTKI
jgi:hypothetical protein